MVRNCKKYSFEKAFLTSTASFEAIDDSTVKAFILM